MKKTKWYPGTVKPVRIGMYETLSSHLNEPVWRFWNGERWGWGYENKRWAYSWRNEPGGIQTEPWRGLTKELKHD